MTTKKEDVKTPEVSDHFSMKVGEETREFFMSAGLLNSLTRFVPSGMQDMVQFESDIALRGIFLTVLLAPRDNFKRPQLADSDGVAFDPNTLEITVKDQEALLDWAGAHVRNFFWNSVQKSLKWATQNEEALTRIFNGTSPLQNLAASANGSPSLPTEKQ